MFMRNKCSCYKGPYTGKVFRAETHAYFYIIYIYIRIAGEGRESKPPECAARCHNTALSSVLLFLKVFR